MNICNFIGNIGKAPNFRTTSSGRAVLNFSIAVDYRVRREDPNTGVISYEKRANWIPVVVFGPKAEHCNRYLQSGSKVAITGRCVPRSYTDANGTIHNTFDIDASAVGGDVQFLDKIRSPTATPVVITQPETIGL